MHDLDLSPYSFTDKAKSEQITPDEELRLLTAYKRDGDIKARDALSHGMRWVPAVTALNRCKGFSILNHFSDMYMEGHIALLEAMETFKLEQGTRFAMYAYTACDRAMKNYIRNSAGSLVRDPVKTIKKGVRSTNKLILNLDYSLDASPTGVDDEDGYAFLGDRRFNPEDAAEKKQIEQRLEEAFTQLSYRERVVVHDCLLGDKKLADLTEQFGNVSVERVRQIGAGGVAKLREAMLKDGQPSTGSRPKSRQSAKKPQPAAAHN